MTTKTAKEEKIDKSDFLFWSLFLNSIFIIFILVVSIFPQAIYQTRECQRELDICHDTCNWNVTYNSYKNCNCYNKTTLIDSKIIDTQIICEEIK